MSIYWIFTCGGIWFYRINIFISSFVCIFMFFWLVWLVYYLSLMPFPFYCGSSIYWIMGVDNGNISFILLMDVMIPIIFWIAGIESNTMNISIMLIIIIILLCNCFFLWIILEFFVIYECFNILLFLVLFIFLPSFYRIRTAFIFFLFTIFGLIFFMLFLVDAPLSNYWFLVVFLIIPFWIKIPCFPMFYWLPEVHCEANSSISLLLAGLLLKLGIFGILRFIIVVILIIMFSDAFIFSLILISIYLISCSSYRYYDLKKMIAFSSILHLNFSFVSILCINGIGVLCGIITSIAHSLSSSSLFFLVGNIINKTYSRYWDSFLFIDWITRLLLLFFILGNLSFAISLNFVGEIFALIGLFSIDYLWLIFYLLSCFLSTFFWFLIMNRKLPYHSCYSSLNYIEFLVLCWLLIINYFCGVLFVLFIIKYSIQKYRFGS